PGRIAGTAPHVTRALHPQRDSNPCYRLERAPRVVQMVWSDDGPSVFVQVIVLVRVQWCQPVRVGYRRLHWQIHWQEPTGPSVRGGSEAVLSALLDLARPPKRRGGPH